MTASSTRGSYTLTFEDAVRVHHMIWDGVLQSRIAALFDVNSGRISEVNTGKLHPGSRDVAMANYKKSA
ncbi:hypothetical protein [Oceaniradius stylonematis]|jgi:predicted XRE-type DNA-binding protein|uniref:hypothetical protein n=1 Tax=Oceaniradius stylonematis TaxID=2184161 RepID=UPI0035CE9E93